MIPSYVPAAATSHCQKCQSVPLDGTCRSLLKIMLLLPPIFPFLNLPRRHPRLKRIWTRLRPPPFKKYMALILEKLILGCPTLPQMYLRNLVRVLQAASAILKCHLNRPMRLILDKETEDTGSEDENGFAYAWESGERGPQVFESFESLLEEEDFNKMVEEYDAEVESLYDALSRKYGLAMESGDYYITHRAFNRRRIDGRRHRRDSDIQHQTKRSHLPPTL